MIDRFANPAVVRPYMILLRSYSQNSSHTNHCIARMLHRLAVDMKMEALLYQLSVFSLFNKILGDPAASAYQVTNAFHSIQCSSFCIFCNPEVSVAQLVEHNANNDKFIAFDV